MFGLAPSHTLAPKAKRTGLHVPAHQKHHSGFVQAKLLLDGFKGRAVLPGHLNDAGKICLAQRCVGHAADFEAKHRDLPLKGHLRDQAQCGV